MIHGIVNVVKPTGMSSHDVIGQLRRIYNMKKNRACGHTGPAGGRCAARVPGAGYAIN